MNLYVGLDVGTTGVKGVLVDENGKIIDIQSGHLTIQTPKPGWSEQDPLNWWKAVLKVLKNLSERSKEAGGRIRAISTSGQMHSLVAIGKNGEVLRNAILWCDQRTYEECKEAESLLGGEEKTLKIVGNSILPGFTLPKILWLRKNEPDVYGKIYKVLLPKDFINYMLTGIIATEHSDASGTMLYSVSEGRWSDQILDAFGISKKFLPDILESNEMIGKVRENLVKMLNLDEEVAVVAGGADNACAALGVSVIDPGDVMISLGTSGTVVAPTGSKVPDPYGRVHFFAHVVPRTMYHMGVMLSAAYSLEWFKHRFLKEDYEVINRQVMKVPIGSNGVIFLPYLNGERSPHKDPYAKGVFFGISSYNSKWDFVRAIFEGVAFGIRDCFEVIEELNTSVKNIRTTGGGARSDVWNVMIADLLSREIQKPLINEGASYGAAMLACSGFSSSSPDQIARRWFKLKTSVKPSLENKKEYDKFYYRFRDLYKGLKSFFHDWKDE
jgi:xylulokinase